MTDTPPSGRTIAYSAVWYTGASFLTKGLGFITIPIFTRLMTPAEFGTFNAFAAFQILLLAVVGLESFQTLNRARFDFGPEELKRYQLTMLTTSALLVTPIGIALLIWPTVFETISTIEQQYLLIMVIYILFYPAFNMFQAYQRVRYKYKLAASLAFLVSIVSTALSVLLVITISDALLGRIVGYYLPFAALGGGIFVYYVFSARRVEWRFLRYAIPLCIPLVIATLGTQGMLLGSRLVVQKLDSPDATAYVALATSVANIALILIVAVNNAWAPWLMDCLKRRRYASASQGFIVLLSAITALVVGTSMLSPEIVAVLGGSEYQQTVPLVPSFMVGCLFTLITSQYIFVETFHKSVAIGGVATLLSAALNVFMCIFGWYLLGYVSVGYASLISSSALLIVHKFAVRRMPSGDIFPFRILAPAIGAGLAAIPLSLWLMEIGDFVFRYSLAVLSGVIAVALTVRVMRQHALRPNSEDASADISTD